MQIVLNGNRVIAHGEDCFLCMGGTVICEETGKAYQNATIAEVESVPADVDIVGYEYHAGVFVPCAPYGTTNSGTVMLACDECGTPRRSRITSKDGGLDIPGPLTGAGPEAQFNKKADKVEGAVVGNYAAFDETGNIVDSGRNYKSFSRRWELIEEFLTEGTIEYTVPDGITRLGVVVVGGGGGGRSARSGSGLGYNGSGGGGGFVTSGILEVTPGQVLSGTVGAKGEKDKNGGSSSFGGLTASGGYAGKGTSYTTGDYGSGGSGGGGTVEGAGHGGSFGANGQGILGGLGQGASALNPFAPNVALSGGGGGAGGTAGKGGAGYGGKGGDGATSRTVAGGNATGNGNGGGGGATDGTYVSSGGAGSPGLVLLYVEVDVE